MVSLGMVSSEIGLRKGTVSASVYMSAPCGGGGVPRVPAREMHAGSVGCKQAGVPISVVTSKRGGSSALKAVMPPTAGDGGQQQCVQGLSALRGSGRARRPPERLGVLESGIEYCVLPAAPRFKRYSGVQHGKQCYVECLWRRSDGVAAGAFLDRWVGAEERALIRTEIVLTLKRAGDMWLPWTLAKESALLKGQLGLFGARPMAAGAVLSWMLDGCSLGGAESSKRLGWLAARAKVRARGVSKRYLYTVKGKGKLYQLMDGEGARAGGAKRSNDALGLRRQGNNAWFCDDGALRVRQWSTITELRAGMSVPEQEQAEVMWSYGKHYWQE